MMLRDYATEDIYIGKWMLDVQELPSGDVKRTRYTVYCCRGTCFIDIASPGGESVSVSCVVPDGEGISLSMASQSGHSYSGEPSTCLLPLVGISFLFVEWIPGLVVSPSLVPLEKALLVSEKSEYTNLAVPCGEKQFVGLVENGMLVALKYRVGDRLYVQATAENQRFGSIKEK